MKKTKTMEVQHWWWLLLCWKFREIPQRKCQLMLFLAADEKHNFSHSVPCFFAVPSFEGAGYSISQTKEVLASIASDCLVDDGYCVNAVEVFWTPSDRNEVLVKNDIILDFPELIDL